tara:strand:+ start:1206 stop:3143 length:1938 start_codon:yes stop_codon:yes gene_type:complete
MSSTSISALGYVRVAAISPELRVADVAFNVDSMVAAVATANQAGATVILFPELSLTGYTCGDLFYQVSLRVDVENGMRRFLDVSREYPSTVLVVGLPVLFRDRLYNCAAVVVNGKVEGIVPKTFIPNSGEYYEQRWFASGESVANQEVTFLGQNVPFGVDILFTALDYPNLKIGIEICEDLWAVQPPSGFLALEGANLLLNLSASNELLGKYEYRRGLVIQQSARCLAAYVYASAGPNESTTDTVFGGHCLIAENGHLLEESKRFSFSTESSIADIDIQHLTNERVRNTSFKSGANITVRNVSLSIGVELEKTKLLRRYERLPFVPSDNERRARNCEEIFSIQSASLAKRLRHTGSECLVVGISGGLDSTLALLVAIRTFDQLKLDRKGIRCITMPGFGTTDRTAGNAESLINLLGTSYQQIGIHDAVLQHFSDIGHDPKVFDVTYENSQARERTQILMDLANKHGGLVLGTGDLSELALGWCTFNGDHMSMYHVNAGVPKTLVKYIVGWCAQDAKDVRITEVLTDICNTPITPELLPPGEAGELVQLTEESVGPYELHDFFLFHVVRHQFPGRKVLELATTAFADSYERETIEHWLQVFFKRFFQQQFKRSAMPDGPKVGTVALSPRSDWRMPSDASVEGWLKN